MNFQLLMYDRFPTYGHSTLEAYEQLKNDFNKFLPKHLKLDYREITMDDLEVFCDKAMPYLDAGFKVSGISRLRCNQCLLLRYILHANLNHWPRSDFTIKQKTLIAAITAKLNTINKR
jgi:hypothetical protein